MIQVTTTNGDSLLIEDSQIKAIARAVTDTVTTITMKNGRPYQVTDSISDIYNTNCPTLMIMVTSDFDNSELLYPTKTIRTIEDAPGNKSRILFNTDRSPIIVKESITDISTQLCQANGGGGSDGNRRGAVLDFVNNTFPAPVSPSTGDRYILDNTGATNPSWGAGPPAPNSIVEWDGAQWVATTPEEGWTAYVDSVNEDVIFEDDGVPGWKLRGRLPIELSNTLVVAANGDDATAIRDRWDRPFANPTTAIAAAQPGDQVIIFPGTYIIGPGGLADTGLLSLIKNGVNVFCYPDVIINHTQIGGTSSQLWSDNGLAVNAQWTGQLVFNGRASGGQYLMGGNINTRLTLKGTKWTGERFAHTAFKVFNFDFDEHEVTRQFFAMNPSVTLDTATFTYKVRRALQSAVAPFTSFAFNANGGAFKRSSITIEIDDYKYGYAFNPFGNIYIGNVMDDDCTLTIDIKSNIQTGFDNLFGIPILYVDDTSRATVNINIAGILRSGRLMEFAFTGNKNLRGNIYFQGLLRAFSVGGRGYSDIRSAQGSLNIKYDIIARPHTSPNGFFIRASGASRAVYLSGKVKWEAPAASQHCIILEENSGSTSHASLDNLKIEVTGPGGAATTADAIGNAAVYAGPPVANLDIPITNVATNQLPGVVSNYTPHVEVVNRNQFVTVE